MLPSARTEEMQLWTAPSQLQHVQKTLSLWRSEVTEGSCPARQDWGSCVVDSIKQVLLYLSCGSLQILFQRAGVAQCIANAGFLLCSSGGTSTSRGVMQGAEREG